jgi:hypothetical protein
MRYNFHGVARIFFSSEALFPFFIGTIFLAILTKAVTQIVFNIAGASTQASILVAIVAIGIFIISVFFVARSLSKTALGEVDLGKKPPAQKKGLILLVSREEPCRKAIEYHLETLKYCWLICSSQTVDIAQKIQRDFPQLRILEPIIIKDIYEPIEFCEAVKKIYKNLPKSWNKKDIISDFTGMTAQGSVGMVLASVFEKIPLQYTPAEFDKDRRPTGRCLSPIEITINQVSEEPKSKGKKKR